MNSTQIGRRKRDEIEAIEQLLVKVFPHQGGKLDTTPPMLGIVQIAKKLPNRCTQKCCKTGGRERGVIKANMKEAEDKSETKATSGHGRRR